MPNLSHAHFLAMFILLIALGVSAADARAAAPAETDIVVDVHNLADNKPLSGVEVTFQSMERADQATTAADGSAHIKIAANPTYASLAAASDGFCSVSINLQTGTPIPAHIDLVMEPAKTIGGVIVDENGNPLPGASVVCQVMKSYPNPFERFSYDWHPIIADAQGKWSLSGVPEDFDTVQLGAYHQECIDGKNSIMTMPFADFAGLKAGTAKYTLHRGTPVQLIIHNPMGQPIPNARVWIATQRGISLGFPETTSDANGIITLGVLPGIHETFTITAKGYAPEFVSEAIGNTPKTFNINLTSGNLLTGSLLDPSGIPVANALVLIQSWRGQEKPFDEEMRTDNSGKFSWPDAPAEDIIVSAVSGSGNKKNVTLRAGKENTIQLLPPSRLTGTVVDAITNQPLSNYRVFYGNGETSKQIFFWLEGSSVGINITHSGNAFHVITYHNDPWFGVRVMADGYLSKDSEAYSEGTDASFVYKLEKEVPIKGSVVNPDGTPAKNATVALALPGSMFQINNGTLAEGVARQIPTAQTAADGSFSLPEQDKPFVVAVLSDNGCALVPQADFQKDSPIQLKAWAKIEGSARRGTKPDVGAQISGFLLREIKQNTPNISWDYNAVADANGKFSFKRVIPAKLSIGRMLRRDESSSVGVDSISFTAKAGETTKIQIGGIGRPIIGHIAIPPDIAAHGYTIRDEMVWPEHTTRSSTYTFFPARDGTFRIDDVAPGTYSLSARVADISPAHSWQPGNPVGTITATFTVPPVPGGVSDEPLDIGELQVTPVTSTPTAQASP